jgi:c-di-GMP-related signal transduction protein
VAEKIETNDEFEMALEEGFRLFQGYYLGRPKVFSKCELPINDVNHIHRLDLYARSKALLAEERGISALSAVGSNGSTYWTD